LGILLAILAALYPILAYAGLKYSSPDVVAAGLILLLLLRYKLSKSIILERSHLKYFTAAVLLILGYSLVTDSSYGVRFYPVAINFLFFVVFAFSLFSQQTIIERIARIKEPELPDSAVSYTRKVTMVWSAFFVFNGGIAGYTALFTNIEIWTLYNGFISYCLMGLLGGGEWLVRKKIRAKE
jgi:uncharacterized membrane protein